MNLLSSIRAALERAFGIAWDWPHRHDNIYASQEKIFIRLGTSFPELEL